MPSFLSQPNIFSTFWYMCSMQRARIVKKYVLSWMKQLYRLQSFQKICSSTWMINILYQNTFSLSILQGNVKLQTGSLYVRLLSGEIMMFVFKKMFVSEIISNNAATIQSPNVLIVLLIDCPSSLLLVKEQRYRYNVQVSIVISFGEKQTLRSHVT